MCPLMRLGDEIKQQLSFKADFNVFSGSQISLTVVLLATEQARTAF